MYVGPRVSCLGTPLGKSKWEALGYIPSSPPTGCRGNGAQSKMRAPDQVRNKADWSQSCNSQTPRHPNAPGKLEKPGMEGACDELGLGEGELQFSSGHTVSVWRAEGPSAGDLCGDSPMVVLERGSPDLSKLLIGNEKWINTTYSGWTTD